MLHRRVSVNNSRPKDRTCKPRQLLCPHTHCRKPLTVVPNVKEMVCIICRGKIRINRSGKGLPDLKPKY